MTVPRIRELFDRDPKIHALANSGQARIHGDPARGADGELRAELETFVCDGQFGDGLQRMLDRFLANLSASRQDAAWVSGFFGSGKSHLLKMLAHLWANTPFDGGTTARALVPGGLPDDVEAALTELDTRARRVGKPLAAAAGTLLGGNQRVRANVLSIILRARRQPTAYPQARFCFWLREHGLLEEVRNAVVSGEEPRDWFAELGNLHVSMRIADAVRAAIPDFAADRREALRAIRSQFPVSRDDLTTDQFVETARDALGEGGAIPITVLVLDEAQQYIGDSADRAVVLTEVVEAIQTRFDGRVALVASGQSALSDIQTANIQKLRDRFRIHVQLTDADVEVVTRKVLLRKKQSKIPPIQTLFDARAGEVDRHLRGTPLGARPEDRDSRDDDYPLLPTRRRFWEECFRAVDAAGAHSQLRSQLRILHESLQDLAEEELGAVIPASDLFHALSADLVSSGALLNELHTRIQRLDDGTRAGSLRRDLAGLVFLVGALPRDKGVDVGLRASAATLSDLLVSDLREDSGPLRRRVEEALGTLTDDGTLMKVGGEYRLQTTEGAAWDREFREQQGALRADVVAISGAREQLFHAAVKEEMAGIRLRHGRSREQRHLVLHGGAEAPPSGGDSVMLWLRNGWESTRREFEGAAQTLGADDPTLHVFVPRQDSDQLRDAIAAAEAAKRVLERRGKPASDEGRDARRGMETRRDEAERRRDTIVAGMLGTAVVLQGGGTEVWGNDLAHKIEQGADASLKRLFPRFSAGDHGHWKEVIRLARQGAPRPFAPVGWTKEPADHPVAKEVMLRVGGGARGREVQDALRRPEFGWPQDGVDAALVYLHRSGRIKATRNGQPVAPGTLDQTGIKTAWFRLEQIVLSVSQRLAIREIFGDLDVTVVPNREQEGTAAFLAAFRRLAGSAGGEAPLPVPPAPEILERIETLEGNEQLLAIVENRDELGRLWTAWKTLGQRAGERMRAWETAAALRRHAEGLPVLDEVAPELDLVQQRRSLLDEMDYVAALNTKLATALRAGVLERHKSLKDAIRQCEAELAGDPCWAALKPEKQEEIRRRNRLETPEVPDIATHEALRRALDGRPLQAWDDLVDATHERKRRVLVEAARLSDREPRAEHHGAAAVAVRRVVLKDEEAVREWIRDTENTLIEAVQRGPVIVR